ncbi:hypothetical protein OBBRIDRAFT_47819 [Obba rivulosa]|uniref:Uncharacterized protein n=1 Tax=Obba rivulosa TaxID=1052685 RepID=A0A8E2AVT0_9APHY|nr:hypothetical protein OBBRIDRAFT_47819 [Obba rivulosa]
MRSSRVVLAHFASPHKPLAALSSSCSLGWRQDGNHLYHQVFELAFLDLLCSRSCLKLFPRLRHPRKSSPGRRHALIMAVNSWHR